MNTLSYHCMLPLAAAHAGRREYYRLDGRGRLERWQYQRYNWGIKEDDFFQGYLQGFDADFDETGILHLVAHDRDGNLYHRISGGEIRPQLIHRQPRGRVEYLGCCSDARNRLHLLYTSMDKERNLQLFYLQGMKNQWHGPFLLGTVSTPGAGAKHPYCHIFSNLQAQVFIIAPALGREQQEVGLILYRMNTSPNRLESLGTIPARGDELGQLSCSVDKMNKIHITWISGCKDEGSSTLKHVSSKNGIHWQQHFQAEVPPGTHPVAPLWRDGNVLLIFYQYNHTICILYSRDGGINWNRGRDYFMEKEAVFTRLRGNWGTEKTGINYEGIFPPFQTPPPSLLEASEQDDAWERENAPGEEEDNWNGEENAGKNIAAGNGVEERLPAFEAGIKSKPTSELFSHILAQARRMEENQRRLLQRLQAKEKELASRRLKDKSKVEALEKILAEKTLRLEEMEQLLLRHQGQQEKEKKLHEEQLKLLRADVLKLQNGKKQLLQERQALVDRVSSMEKKNMFKLEEESGELKTKWGLIKQFVQKILVRE